MKALFIRRYATCILVPRGRIPFGQHQESPPLRRSNFLRMRRVIISYSQPIRFVRLDSERARSDGTSVNRGLPVLDKARGLDSWCWPKGALLLGTRMFHRQKCRSMSSTRSRYTKYHFFTLWTFTFVCRNFVFLGTERPRNYFMAC